MSFYRCPSNIYHRFRSNFSFLLIFKFIYFHWSPIFYIIFCCIFSFRTTDSLNFKLILFINDIIKCIKLLRLLNFFYFFFFVKDIISNFILSFLFFFFWNRFIFITTNFIFRVFVVITFFCLSLFFFFAFKFLLELCFF